MALSEFHYKWEYHLKSSPEDLWPLVADTDRFDRDTGLPPLEDRTGEQRLPNARIRARFYRFGIPVEYTQDPFEWTQPYRFGIVRRFSKGPVREQRVLAELKRRDDGGTHLVYQTWLAPANLLGLIAIPVQVGLLSALSFRRVFHWYDKLAQEQKSFYDVPARVNFAPGGRERLKTLGDAFLEQTDQPDIARRLLDLIAGADVLTLSRLRPYALADHWGVSRRLVLEQCLLATRMGLMGFQWDLLCPMCRSPRDSQPSLAGVRSEVHCRTCNIDFEVNFDRSVELTFRPSPAIRPVDESVYCINAPMATPHVVVQQLLPPGETRKASPVLQPGRYRLRALELRGGQYVRVDEEGDLVIHVRAQEDEDWPADEPVLSRYPTLRLENLTENDQLLMLEHMAWTEEAATAAEVTVLQRFRDLFSHEALRPGERISVGSLTILFTDLLESTRMYRSLGDAQAFGVVMDHFDVLKSYIELENGAIVKTIGDSVMAVFRQPVHALRAILWAQRALQSNSSTGALYLKAGIHHGPCIAVALNDQLDYFGSTVNIAARLENLSTGREIVVSDAVRTDPQVELLFDRQPEIVVEPVQTSLRGYDEETFNVWLVALQDDAVLQQATDPAPE